MSGVDPNSPAGKAIASQIDNPGNYSISQLYADFMSKPEHILPFTFTMRDTTRASG
jgi:hypothetical protein